MQDLKLISDFYDFMLWLVQHVEKFPRHHRYSLGMTIEGGLQTILSLLLRAKYSRDKVAPLTEANLELEILRFRVRMAKDLRVLPLRSHAHAAERMQAVGRQIGGWLASKAPKA